MQTEAQPLPSQLVGEFGSKDEPGPGKERITVISPPREQFKGYWCAKIFWPTGKTTRWVTRAEREEIERDPLLSLITIDDAFELVDELAAAPKSQREKELLEQIAELKQQLLDEPARVDSGVSQE